MRSEKGIGLEYKFLDFSTRPIDTIGNIRVDCDCGNLHVSGVKSVLLGAGATRDFGAALARIVPPLSAVLILSDADVREGTARFFEKAIARLGYRVHVHTYPSTPVASVQSAELAMVSEDTRLIVGVGGGTVCDLTKYIAARKKLPCAFVVTSPACIGALTSGAAIESDGLEEVYQTQTFSAVLCDTDFFQTLPIGLLPSAFGELMSKAVSLFDYQVSARLNGERFCPHLLNAAIAVLDETLMRVKRAGRNAVASILAEGSLRYSALAALMGNSRLLGGGEVQLAHTVRLLFRHEARPARFRGEVEMLSARTVIRLYQNLLGRFFHSFVPPPDNNARLADAVEYFGLSEWAAMRKIRPLISARALRLYEYRFGEYRLELVTAAEQCAARLDRAFGLFKRFYPDDGYAVTRYIEPTDIPLTVALAPDLKDKYTMLSYMKDMGLLENIYER